MTAHDSTPGREKEVSGTDSDQSVRTAVRDALATGETATLNELAARVNADRATVRRAADRLVRSGGLVGVDAYRRPECGVCTDGSEDVESGDP